MNLCTKRLCFLLTFYSPPIYITNLFSNPWCLLISSISKGGPGVSSECNLMDRKHMPPSPPSPPMFFARIPSYSTFRASYPRVTNDYVMHVKKIDGTIFAVLMLKINYASRRRTIWQYQF